ncbi:hypothetical protein GCM10009422_26770 [Brevundimonas kwangchunensis]|uniref:Uncharacterized protein n=2 Tax=Brevundimonas kwangchunensis TaxID=322163 RepID=A0ABP3S7F4_9CAUL
MPVFEARLVEIKGTLDAPNVLDVVTKIKLKDKVDLIKRIHDDLFVQIINLISDRSRLADKAGFDATWVAFIDASRKRLADVFNTEPTAQTLPPPWNTWWKQVQWQEDECLKTALLTDWRGHFIQIVAFQTNMSKLIGEMDDKWKQLQADSDGLVEPGKKAVDLMTKSVNQSIDNLSSFRKMASEVIITVKSKSKSAQAEAATKVGDIILKDQKSEWKRRVTEVAAETIGGAAKATVGVAAAGLGVLFDKATASAAENAKNFLEGIEKYRSLMNSTGFVIGMFNTNRQLVQKYRAEQNLPRITAAKSSAEATLAQRTTFLSHNGFSVGSGVDAQALANRLMKFVNDFYGYCVNVESDFMSRFKGVFEAEKSGLTIEALTDKALFDKYLFDTLYRISIKDSAKQLAQLPEEFRQLVSTTDPSSQFDSLPEEVRLIWLDKSKEFQQEIQRIFDDMLKSYLTRYVNSQGALEALTLEAPGKLNRDYLTAMITN